MKEFLPEHILVGKTSDLSRWVEHAANAGILWCYERERRRGRRCSTSCIRDGGCAIVEDSILLNVFPVEDVPNFDGRNYEGMLVLIPSKKLGIGDVDDVKSLVTRFMSTFRDSSVRCFESTTSSREEIEWRPFAWDGSE
jgi:hypothetical protein